MLAAWEPIGAQSPIGRTYGVVSAGPAIESAGSNDPVRSHWGIAAEAGLGHQWLPRLSAEVDVSGAWFSAPQIIFAPSSQSNESPARAPSGAVHAAALTTDVIIGDGAGKAGGSFLLGVGVRHLFVDPAGSGVTAPLIQIGFGAAFPLQNGRVMIIGVRAQCAASAGPPCFIPLVATLRL